MSFRASSTAGWVAPEVGAELRGLALRQVLVERGSGRSSRAVKQRLRDLAERFGGAQALNLRHRAIPWAYRVFFRHIGIDPDVQRTPIEALVLARMSQGGLRSRNLLDDALTIATLESEVALCAFDADRVDGRLGIRPAGAGEELEGAPELRQGTLVIADEHRPVGILFGPIAEGRGVGPKTARMLICAIQVRGVPDIAVEEALWLVTGILEPDGD